jgi:hypothetical protein
VLFFSEWPTALGGRRGAIYSPDIKRAVGDSFQRTSPVGHWTSPVELSGSRSGDGLVWSTGLVWWGPDVIPDFVSETMYTSHVCSGSFIPHTQI